MTIGDGNNPIGTGPIGGGPIGPWPSEAEDTTVTLDHAEWCYQGQGLVFQLTLAVAHASVAIAGQDVSFRYTLAVQHAEIAVQGSVSFEVELALAPAQIAVAGQHLDVSTPAMPVQVAQLAVEGQDISFQHFFRITPAQVAYQGQTISFTGALDLDHFEIAVEPQVFRFQQIFAVSPAQIAYQGQTFPLVYGLAVEHAYLAVEGQAIIFRQTVKPQLDRYPYCGRSGFRVALSRLVEDGRVPGLYVEQGWDDDIHPQDWPQHIGADGGKLDRSAPPQDPVEEYEQVVLVVDGESIEV